MCEGQGQALGILSETWLLLSKSLETWVMGSMQACHYNHMAHARIKTHKEYRNGTYRSEGD